MLHCNFTKSKFIAIFNNELDKAKHFEITILSNNIINTAYLFNN